MQPPKLSSEVKEVQQSYNPIRKNINVLSHYLLKQNEIEPVRFITKIKPKIQNVFEISTKEGDTHLPVRSDFGSLSLGEEDIYLFQSEENQNGNNNSYTYDSETSKNENFASFHDSSQNSNMSVVSIHFSHIFVSLILLKYQRYAIIKLFSVSEYHVIKQF